MTPRRRMGVWVLSHTQLGLLLGCAGIGLLLAFGGGFIVGVWYHASERVSPYPEGASIVADAPPQTDSQDLTFYSTLTKSDNLPAPATPSGAGKSAQRPAHAQGRGGATPLKAGERVADAAGQGQSPAPRAPVGVKGSERQTAPARPSHGAAAKMPSSSGAYSVQVGSFRSRDQAESLMTRLTQKGYRVSVKPTTIPDKGVWYRVRVGGFPERGAADRLAQQLVAQDRVAGVVIDGSR